MVYSSLILELVFVAVIRVVLVSYYYGLLFIFHSFVKFVDIPGPLLIIFATLNFIRDFSTNSHTYTYTRNPMKLLFVNCIIFRGFDTLQKKY